MSHEREYVTRGVPRERSNPLSALQETSHATGVATDPGFDFVTGRPDERDLVRAAALRLDAVADEMKDGGNFDDSAVLLHSDLKMVSRFVTAILGGPT